MIVLKDTLPAARYVAAQLDIFAYGKFDMPPLAVRWAEDMYAFNIKKAFRFRVVKGEYLLKSNLLEDVDRVSRKSDRT